MSICIVSKENIRCVGTLIDPVTLTDCMVAVVGSSDTAGDVGNSSCVNDDGECPVHVSPTPPSSYSESDFMLMSSLQLAALKSLAVLLSSSRYMEMLLVPCEGSNEKTTSTQDSADDLQVDWV